MPGSKVPASYFFGWLGGWLEKLDLIPAQPNCGWVLAYAELGKNGVMRHSVERSDAYKDFWEGGR